MFRQAEKVEKAKENKKKRLKAKMLRHARKMRRRGRCSQKRIAPPTLFILRSLILRSFSEPGEGDDSFLSLYLLPLHALQKATYYITLHSYKGPVGHYVYAAHLFAA